jgi:hypothetical protein
LLKLEYSPATDPRRGWMETIARERLDAERLLEDSPSLRGEIARMISQEGPGVARLTTRVLFGHGEGVGTLAAPTYVEDQVLGDWFPPAPPP